MTTSPLAADFIAGYAGHTSGPNGQITRVVIHATVSPCQRGGARANARYFQSPNSGGLAHYIIDPGELIGCCDEDTACWHAPPNHGSIGVELCDPQTGDDWGDPDHHAMLQLAAELVRDICTRRGLPIVWLTPSELLAGDTGITGHAQVSQAWHKTDHTDPGPYFPTDHFIELVAGPAAPPAPSQEDKVLHLIKGDQKPEWYVTDWITKAHVPSQDHANIVIFDTVAAGGKITYQPNNQPKVHPQSIVDALR